MPRGTVKNSSGEGIGSVKYSPLSEAQFQALYGTGWVLYDNRSVVGSSLNTKYGVATLHDHRGLYPRAKNNGRSDGKQNPAGELAIGTYQEDFLQDHVHVTVLQDDNFQLPNLDPQELMDNDTSGSTSSAPWTSSGLFTGKVNANETKVKALILNAFIKINN
jgi:hypothetical protein